MDSNPSRIAESGVFVGRDVIKSIIVTGNHNQFFIGGYARLRDAYIYPSTVFDDLDRDGFAGRGWLCDRIDAFISGKPCGYIILTAEAGMGKTRFLAWLARERGYIHHFAQSVYSNNSIGDGLRSIAAQLIVAYRLEPYISNEDLPDIASRSDFLYTILKQAAANRSPNEKIIVVVPSFGSNWRHDAAGRNAVAEKCMMSHTFSGFHRHEKGGSSWPSLPRRRPRPLRLSHRWLHWGCICGRSISWCRCGNR
ncbi:MAG: ATP-binding protein [Kouleothrix sp.]|jgi:hypothetical protein|nr:ATP-binding protein [Kouleothrix sp.]